MASGNQWNDLFSGLIQGGTNFGLALVDKAERDQAKQDYITAKDSITQMLSSNLQKQNQILSGGQENTTVPQNNNGQVGVGLNLPFGGIYDQKIPQTNQVDVLGKLLEYQANLEQSKYGKPYSDALGTMYNSLNPKKDYQFIDSKTGIYLVDKNSGQINQIVKNPEAPMVDLIKNASYYKDEATGKYYKEYSYFDKNAKKMEDVREEINEEQYLRGRKETTLEREQIKSDFRVPRVGSAPKIQPPNLSTQILNSKLTEFAKLKNLSGINWEQSKDPLTGKPTGYVDKNAAEYFGLQEDIGNMLGTNDPKIIEAYVNQFANGELKVDDIVQERNQINSEVGSVLQQTGLDKSLNDLYMVETDPAKNPEGLNQLQQSADAIYKWLGDNYHSFEPQLIDAIYKYVNEYVKAVYQSKTGG